jgi:hypothetical protein
LVLLRRWRVHGLDESPVDSEAMNDALQGLCLALEPREAVRLCLESAAAIEAEIETVPDDLVRAIDESPTHFRFDRSLHRSHHLGEIEAALGLTAQRGGA